MFGPAAQQRPAPDSAWLLGAAFLLLFLFLDWVSYIRPVHGLNITPWNPASPLAIALLMWNRRWLWIVWLALVAGELIVRGLPTSWFVTLAATAALSFAYAAIAQALERRLDRLRPLTTRSDLLWFTAVAVVGALICSAAYVGTFSMAGLGPGGPVHKAMVRYWIGDAVGMLVVLPLLFVLLDPVRRAALLATLKARPTWLAAAVIGALTGIVFGWGSHNQFKYFYLLLLPVVWLSATRGVPGAVLAIGLTQFGLIVAVHLVPSPDLTVFELQALMAVLTMTGLLLGVAADERSRAEAELRGTLHLAAAGQMAAALAHELSQPLTALSNYADACEVIAGQLRALDAKRSARLVDVSRRIVDDSRRAGDIVKRLRDFFRTGATQLRSMSPSTTLHEAIDAQLRRAQALRVELGREIPERLPAVWMDEVQIGVVLRNLLANALDAVSASGAPGRVLVRVAVGDGDLRIEVHDSGGGVDRARLQVLFEPGPSDKPSGMGIGLSICREIVEAHGGRLWTEPGSSGLFCFTLPSKDDEPTHPNDAS